MIPQHPKPLRHFIENGIGLKPDTPGADQYIYDLNQIIELWGKGVRNFKVYPYQSNLVIIDLKSNGGVCGFYSLFGETVLPACIQNIDSHPCHVRTPSGGYQLYFLYTGTKKFKSGIIKLGLTACKIIHFDKETTAPGSETEAGAQRLFGLVDNMPLLPTILEKLLPEHIEKPVKRMDQKHRTYNNAYDQKQISLDKIKEIIDKQGIFSMTEGSRDNYCFAIAHMANNKGHAYSETESFLMSIAHGIYPDNDIRKAVKSAYKGP